MATASNPVTIDLDRGRVTISDANSFTEKFLKAYLSRGLGSASKKDIDLILVDLLVNRGHLATTPLHEISLLLQIPESRLAGLIYEAKLRFSINASDELRSAVLARLSAASFDYDSGWVMFAIEDRLIRQAFAAEMKVIGHFADGSFSREVVRVKQESLLELIEQRFLDTKQRVAIVKAVSASLAKSDKFLNGITFRKIMTKFVEGAATQTGSLGVSTVAAALTGGVSLPVTLTSAVKTFFSKGLHK